MTLFRRFIVFITFPLWVLPVTFMILAYLMWVAFNELMDRS